MATSTFDKDIVIEQEAAERLVQILEKPAPPRPDLGENYWAENERNVKEWMSRFEK